jgi:outer membrane protein assembly factor BamD
MNKGILVGLVMVVAFGAFGSAGCRRKTNLPAAGSVEADLYLFEHGTDSLKRKRWIEAREYFKKLVDTYPQSQYRQDSKLGIGDSYLGEDTIESNILAANEFREFLSFFPGNARTDYAQYKIAIAASNQMLGPDRDPTPAREALNACNIFLRNYPNSALKADVETVKRKAQDQLSGYDFKVGRHYYRVGWFPGALDRFKTLLEADPEYYQRDEIYYMTGEMYHRTDRDKEAVPYYDRVIREFEKSEFIEKSKKRLEEIARLKPELKPTDSIKR